MPLKFWLTLGAIIVVLSGMAGLYRIGRIDGVNAERRAADQKSLTHLRRAIEQAAEIARQDAEIFLADDQRRAKVIGQFKTIEREVNRYASNHHDDRPCLDADGLRAWRAASRGDAAEIDALRADDNSGVSANLAGAEIGDGAGAAEQLHGDGQALSPVARAVHQLDRLGAQRTGAAVGN